MVRVYNLKTKEQIEFGLDLIRRNDDFISLEFPEGFNWFSHSENCVDCKAFIKATETNSREWILELDGTIRMIDFSLFESRESHFANLLSLSGTNGILQTCLKLRLLPFDRTIIENELELELQKENFERCCHLRDVIKEMNQFK